MEACRRLEATAPQDSSKDIRLHTPLSTTFAATLTTLSPRAWRKIALLAA